MENCVIHFYMKLIKEEFIFLNIYQMLLDLTSSLFLLMVISLNHFIFMRKSLVMLKNASLKVNSFYLFHFFF